MRVPVIRGTIDRRILVNFRVAPDILASLLPKPFRPKLVSGYGMVGMCLIRLKHIRPRLVPRALGSASENAAHRIAVEWEQGGEHREGVFIPRRDTSSRLNTLLGGRLFPGMHHHARFQVAEGDGRYQIKLNSDDEQVHFAVDASVTRELPGDSVFGSLDAAAEFFRGGSLGYSVTADQSKFDGLALRSFNWSMTPLAVERVTSSYFENQDLFPSNSITFDSALLMANIEHEWHAQEPVCS